MAIDRIYVISSVYSFRLNFYVNFQVGFCDMIWAFAYQAE